MCSEKEKADFINLAVFTMGLPHMNRSHDGMDDPSNFYIHSPPRIPKADAHVHTPPAQNTRNGDLMDMGSTLAPESASVSTLYTERQFDIIATKVNSTIQDLNRIYNEIGYSETEISEKKGDIFQVIQETISSFALNLQREKNNIQNECEWLRQQIRIILAMLNDTQGEKTLKLSSRGVVFDNEEMYKNGYKEDVLEQMNNYHASGHGAFYSSSPFNTANILPSDDFFIQQQYEYMVDHTPELSLLQLKARLNTIFLDVLRAFVEVYCKLNDLTLVFWENIDTIGECWTVHSNVELLKSLPSKSEAEELSNLLLGFKQTTEKLKLNECNAKTDLMLGTKGKIKNDYAFIVSSPKKPRNKELDAENKGDGNTADIQDAMENLRNINYKIVRAIRGFKLTKVTSDVVSSLTKEVEWTEAEMCRRKDAMKEVIGRCLSLINSLSLSKHDVISIQKMKDLSEKEKSSENYFDVETLKFIEENPREFGLMDHHLEFVTRFAKTLQSIKDAKQKKWDFYSNACVQLWEKLGENREYILLFLDTNSSLTDMSLTNLKMELNRLYMKRSEFIESFISDTRKEIQQYQDALLYSEMQRKNFKYYDLNVNDEAIEKELVLKEHEDEVERLKAEYATREPILKLYVQLKELLEDQSFLIESSKDSSRLLSKNSCKILLNEEKIRKKINKSMPRVLEALKQETIKYNNEQLSKGQRPMSIDGQDFFERILLIEAEQANQSNSKFGRGRNQRSTSSLRKASIASTTRNSPLKSRSPNKIGKEQIPKSQISPSVLRSNNSGSISPVQHLKRVFEGTSKDQPTVKSASKTIDANFGRNLFESPPKSYSRGVSALSRLGGTHLQPLNSPLGPDSIYSDNGSETRGDSRSDNSTLYSMCTRVSPLRNDNRNNSMRTNFSPIKGFDPVQSLVEGKENTRDSIDTKFSLSPIRVASSELQFDNEHESKRLSSNSLANSTIIGDDYKQWREERIREINNRM